MRIDVEIDTDLIMQTGESIWQAPKQWIAERSITLRISEGSAMVPRSEIRGPLLINPVIYAELATGFDSIESLDRVIECAKLELREIPRDGLYLAGQAHVRYRHHGGTRAV